MARNLTSPTVKINKIIAVGIYSPSGLIYHRPPEVRRRREERRKESRLKILDRYILKEMASTFLVGIGAFTIVLLLDKIIRLTELILNKGVGIWVALRLFLFLLPSFLTLTIPMATLLATLTTFGLMASDKEVTAMKTSGISMYRLLFPPLLFAMWAFVLNLFLSVYVMPW